MEKKERLRTTEEYDCVISSLQRNQRAKLHDRLELLAVCIRGSGYFVRRTMSSAGTHLCKCKTANVQCTSPVYK
jgi:hypothetical protein